MLGKILVYASFAFAAISAIIYLISFFKKEKLNPLGSTFYYLTTLGVVGISVYLLSNILAHNFQFTYIWEYSSRELTDPLLVASFYSGQQGSFLLWGLFIALIGLFLIPSARKYGYESIVLSVHSFILMFVLMMLVAKSPFDYIWETYAGQADYLVPGFTPENGRGLNPILQNYWISIHPPILFTGYSAMVVPFVFAIAALAKRDYKNWIKPSIPWTLFATGILGLGIMLGGFWAYETLGWGGFWGWDPVENSSLLPWLVAVALVHTLIVQRTKGGLWKTNITLSITAFMLVLYATFLTRSGILGDTSVHSFVEPGYFIYVLLLLFMIVFGVLGYGMLMFRTKDINNTLKSSEFKLASKEFSLSIGAVLLLASTSIIFIGTSWPWIAELLGKPKSAIDIQIYNDWNLPIAILLMTVNSFSLFMRWNSSSFGKFFKDARMALIFALASSILFFLIGVRDFGYLLLTFASLFAIFSNVEYIVKAISKNKASLGAYIAHFGVAVLLLGVVATGGYSVSQEVQLRTGETKKVFDYTITFKGKERIEKHLSDREKYRYLIELENNEAGKAVVHPIIYWSDFNDRSSAYLEPGIKTFISRDIYVSPMSLETESNIDQTTLVPGLSVILPSDTNYTISLIDFDRSKGMESFQEGFVTMGAIVSIQNRITDEISYDTLWSMINMQNMNGNPVWSLLPQTNKIEAGFVNFAINQKDVAKSGAMLVFKEQGKDIPAPIEIFTMEVSLKPFMNLVWLGTFAITLGFFYSAFKYRQKLHKIRKEETFQDENPSEEIENKEFISEVHISEE